jgi:eukaryotic-like serine/threonine-protein kinase
VAGHLSPDGKWATTIVSNAHLLLLPTGAGTARQIEPGDIQQYWNGAYWMPDSKEIVFSANRRGHEVQCFVQDVDGGKPRSVTPEGVNFCKLSPDGRLIAGANLTGDGGWLYPIEGGQPRLIPGLQAGETFAWSSDPRLLYVYKWRQSPIKVYRLNVLTGQREFFREMTPPDVAGLRGIFEIYFSSDARAYVYGYSRQLSQLYLVNGLK